MDLNYEIGNMELILSRQYERRDQILKRLRNVISASTYFKVKEN